MNDKKFKLKKYDLITRTLIHRKKKWDGKWRIVIFDVWEKARSSRDSLRYEIKNFGFRQLQRSVWIYPYECRDFIWLLKSNFFFGKNIRYMVVEELDHDEKLKKYFKLN